MYVGLGARAAAWGEGEALWQRVAVPPVKGHCGGGLSTLSSSLGQEEEKEGRREVCSPSEASVGLCLACLSSLMICPVEFNHR